MNNNEERLRIDPMTVIERLLRWNPLAARYAFPQLRPRNLAISLSMYAVVLVVILLMEQAVGEFGLRGLFHKLMILQVLMLCIVGLYVSGSVVRDEQRDQSVDFFRMLPITPRARIVGLLVGRNFVLLAVCAFNLLLATLLGLMSGIAPLLVIEVAALVTAIGLVLMLTAILSSTYYLHRRTSGGPMGLVLLCVFLLPYVFGLAAYGAENYPDGGDGSFFGLRIRLVTLITLVVVYFGAWIYRGLVRRFLYEREPLLTATGVILFVAGFCCLMLGLFYNRLQSGSGAALITLASMTAVPLVVVPFGSARRYDDYVEAALATGRRIRLPFRNTNLSAWLIADGIWFVTMWLAARAAGSDLPVSALLALGTFWITLQWLQETAIVCVPLTNRVTQAALFGAALMIGLPLLLGGMFKSSELIWLSPVGYLGMLASMAEPQRNFSEYTAWAWCGPLVLNILLLGLFGRIITRRYRGINALANDDVHAKLV